MKKRQFLMVPIITMFMSCLVGCDNKLLSEYAQKAEDIISELNVDEQEINNLKAEIDALKKNTNESIDLIKEDYSKKISNLESAFNEKSETLKNDYLERIENLDKNNKESLETLDNELKAELNKAKADFQTALESLANELESAIKTIQDDYNEKIENLDTNHKQLLGDLDNELKTELNKVKSDLQTDITNLNGKLDESIKTIQDDYNDKINHLIERISALENIPYHTVTFDTQGGTEIEPVLVLHNEKIDEPIAPTREGFTFEGWTYLNQPWVFIGYNVTKDITLEANWKYIDYDITFQNDDGTILKQINGAHYGDQLVYDYDDPIKPNQEEHYIYSFNGWDGDLLVTGNKRDV